MYVQAQYELWFIKHWADVGNIVGKKGCIEIENPDNLCPHRRAHYHSNDIKISFRRRDDVIFIKILVLYNLFVFLSFKILSLFSHLHRMNPDGKIFEEKMCFINNLHPPGVLVKQICLIINRNTNTDSVCFVQSQERMDFKFGSSFACLFGTPVEPFIEGDICLVTAWIEDHKCPQRMQWQWRYLRECYQSSTSALRETASLEIWKLMINLFCSS